MNLEAYKENILKTSFYDNDLIRFYLTSDICGYVTKNLANYLSNKKEFTLDSTLRFDFSKYNDLTLYFRALTQELKSAGMLRKYRGEEFSIKDSNSVEVLRMERALLRIFGLKYDSIHINGIIKSGENKSKMWISRRSAKKLSDPLKLDNITAGGISAGESILEGAYREMQEEAGIPLEIAKKIKIIETIHFLSRDDEYIDNEFLHIAILDLPCDFKPSAYDGEVEEFYLIDFDECVKKILKDEFTADATLSIISYLNFINKIHYNK